MRHAQRQQTFSVGRAAPKPDGIQKNLEKALIEGTSKRHFRDSASAARGTVSDQPPGRCSSLRSDTIEILARRTTPCGSEEVHGTRTG